MPAVSYERAWLKLKAVVDSKSSHSRSDLHRVMNTIEVECEVPEAEEGFDSRPLPRQRSDAVGPLASEHARSEAMVTH